MQVFFGVINGADELSRTVPFLESFAAARGSGATVFEIIDRKSKIDSMPVNVERTSFKTRGDVKFQDVVFSYPSRPDLKVLKTVFKQKIFKNDTSLHFCGFTGTS